MGGGSRTLSVIGVKLGRMKQLPLGLFRSGGCLKK